MFLDDVVVADSDGAVVIPAALLAEVVATASEQERLEAWILREVGQGAALPGLYPPNAASMARCAASTGPRPAGVAALGAAALGAAADRPGKAKP